MLSWNGREDLLSNKYLVNFEKHLADCLAFNSNQSAISACLETLGSRFQPISVIMPVNCPFDALMGVIKAGGRPVVVDLDKHTFQADPVQVSEALTDLPEAVVYLNRPGGLPISERLLEVVQDVPTICDARVLPVEEKMLCTFNIYDLSLLVGSGSVLFTQNPDLVKDITTVRTESNSQLPEVLAAMAYQRQPMMVDFPRGCEYGALLEKSEETGIIGFGGYAPSGLFLVQVEDATKVVTNFTERGLPTSYGCVPVYRYEIVRKRFPDKLNYPVAEELFGQLVLLPDNDAVNRELLLSELWKLTK